VIGQRVSRERGGSLPQDASGQWGASAATATTRCQPLRRGSALQATAERHTHAPQLIVDCFSPLFLFSSLGIDSHEPVCGEKTRFGIMQCTSEPPAAARTSQSQHFCNNGPATRPALRLSLVPWRPIPLRRSIPKHSSNLSAPTGLRAWRPPLVHARSSACRPVLNRIDASFSHTSLTFVLSVHLDRCPASSVHLQFQTFINHLSPTKPPPTPQR
jgi:hypothetical protein